MSAPVETTAAMTTPGETTAATVGADPAEPHEPHEPHGPSAADQPGAIAALGTAGEQPVATPQRDSGARDGPRRGERHDREPVSTNVLLSVLGGLITALLTGMITLQAWQFNSLGDRIDKQGADLGARIDKLDTRIDQQGANLGDRIDQQGASLGDRIDQQGADLRAEMQAGFREINEILLDHADRLARLETAIELSRPDQSAVAPP